MWHDQSLEGRISCTIKSMIFDNRSFMTGGTTMNDWWYDLFATDGTTYLLVRIAGETFWNMFKNFAETDFASTIVHDLSDKSCAVSANKHDCQNFGSYIGCNLVVSLVWLTPNMFKTLLPPILLVWSSTTSATTRALFLWFTYDSHKFGLCIGCNLVIITSLVWLTFTVQGVRSVAGSLWRPH